MEKKSFIENITIYKSLPDVCTIEIDDDNEEQVSRANLTKEQVLDLAFELMSILKNMDD